MTHSELMAKAEAEGVIFYEPPDYGCKPPTEGVPVHVERCYLPGGEVWMNFSVPERKIDGLSRRCRYCHKTHNHWWQMSNQDYGTDCILCGRCGYTAPVTKEAEAN